MRHKKEVMRYKKVQKGLTQGVLGGILDYFRNTLDTERGQCGAYTVDTDSNLCTTGRTKD